MSWLDKLKPPRFSGSKLKVDIPSGLWSKCQSCQEILYQLDIERNLNVCPKCQHHYKIGAYKRIEFTVDQDSFIEYSADLTSADPLSFKDSKKYKDRIKEANKKTGINSAFVYGEATIEKIPLAIGAFEFSYLGGSMGSVVGEKVSRTFELAIEKSMPAVIFSVSGGARMQEGILSLMQMAKTCSTLALMKKQALPYVSVLTDPTTGGVAASFAMLGDFILAEPKALICFAGPRVIEQTIRQKLPDGFQRSEFLLAHGMIDRIVQRSEIRSTLVTLLSFFSGKTDSTKSNTE